MSSDNLLGGPPPTHLLPNVEAQTALDAGTDPTEVAAHHRLAFRTERAHLATSRSGRKKARTSSTSARGSSIAAKCPPAGITVQRCTL